MTSKSKLPDGLVWRGNLLWIDLSRNGKRVRESTKTADVKLAKARLSKVETSLHEGTYHAPRKNGLRGEYTVAKAFDAAITGSWLIDGSDASKEMARSHLTQLVKQKYLENGTPITAIDAKFLQKLQRSLIDAGLAKNTVNGRLWVLQSLLRQAKADGAIRTLPDFPKKLSNKEGRRSRYLSVPEEEAILAYLSDDEDLRDLWVIALDTGMRHFEIVRIGTKEFDEHRRRVNVPATWAKNGDSRSVPLTARVVEILKRRLTITDKAFPLPHGGKVHPRYWCTRLGKRWREIREEMKLPADLVIHTARHTAATRLFEVNTDTRTAQAILGHRGAATTMAYAKVVDSRLDDAAARIERLHTKEDAQS